MQRKPRTLAAAVLAVLLALFFAPAAVAGPGNSQKTPDETPNDHPSGKDRSDKPSEGKTQGKSQSDPDGDTNGGADKPGMDGGFDADKDGNNGCGNDDDFEDDNNGWCGKKPKVSAASLKQTQLKKVDTTTTESASVLGVTLERSVPAPEVLGATMTAAAPAPAAAAPAGTLAATGSNIGLMALAGWTLVAIGTVCVVLDRRRVTPLAVRIDE